MAVTIEEGLESLSDEQDSNKQDSHKHLNGSSVSIISSQDTDMPTAVWLSKDVCPSLHMTDVWHHHG